MFENNDCFQTGFKHSTCLPLVEQTSSPAPNITALAVTSC